MKTKKLLIYTLLVLGILLLIGIKPVYAQNGPDSGWALIELCNENGDRVYYKGDVNNSIVEGMTYDKDTNTLTLRNHKSTYTLNIEQMGEDFKLNLIGENEVGAIIVNDGFDYYTCNLNITGYGCLTVNKERNEHVAAISIYNGKLIVEETVTLKLYAYEDEQDINNNRSIICINNDIENEDNSIIFRNGDTPVITTSGEYIHSVDLASLTILPRYLIEIENSDLSLKVGEKPLFNANIKDNRHNLKLAQTIISNPDRWSTISSEEDPYNDSDDLVKNLKYDYIMEVTIENSEGNIFDENIKLFVDGVEWTDFAFVSENTFYIYMEDKLTPEGYIEPTVLDEFFEEEQIRVVEEKVIQDIKAGKVEYKNGFDFTAEETKEAIQNALENGDEINALIYVSKTLHKSLINAYFDEDETSGIEDKIGENQKLGAYYYIEIEVLVNDDIVGYISQIETPIQITVPLPNGLPKVSDGYQRVLKIIRKHEGSIDVLDAKQTENGISFENDKFSAFAAVYEDVKIAQTEDTKQEETVIPSKENTNKSATNNPKTGDSITLWISLALMSMFGVVGTMNIFRKEKTNRH